MTTNGINALGKGRTVRLGHQLAYGGGNLLGSGALGDIVESVSDDVELF